MQETLANWLNDQFLKWEIAQGKRQTISAFARYLGVPQSSLSSWMAGAYEPSGENLLKIAQKLGREIYEILGIESPPIANPEIIQLAEKWDYLSEDDRKRILNIAKKGNQSK